MTTAELEQTAAALTAIDAQLAGLPVSGRVAQEVAANRAQISETAKFVAMCLREQREPVPESVERDALVRELAGHGQGRTGDLHSKPIDELRSLREAATDKKRRSDEKAAAELAAITKRS